MTSPRQRIRIRLGAGTFDHLGDDAAEARDELGERLCREIVARFRVDATIDVGFGEAGIEAPPDLVNDIRWTVADVLAIVARRWRRVPLREAAPRMNYTPSGLRNACAAGRIPGARVELDGHRATWTIPNHVIERLENPGPGRPAEADDRDD